jgi:hypothetical protein
MPIRIQFIHEDKMEKEKQVCDKREIAKITFSYLQKEIGLFDKSGYILQDDQVFSYS